MAVKPIPKVVKKSNEFNIHDEVFMIHSNKVKKFNITSIMLSENGKFIEYAGKSDNIVGDIYLPIEFIFKTKDQLLKSL